MCTALSISKKWALCLTLGMRILRSETDPVPAVLGVTIFIFFKVPFLFIISRALLKLHESLMWRIGKVLAIYKTSQNANGSKRSRKNQTLRPLTNDSRLIILHADGIYWALPAPGVCAFVFKSSNWIKPKNWFTTYFKKTGILVVGSWCQALVLSRRKKPFR